MLESDGQTFWDEVRDQLREQIASEERNKGIKTGEKRGQKKGLKKALRSQLKARFGKRLPAWVTERLAEAKEADLQRWILRFAKANRTLKQIFLS